MMVLRFHAPWCAPCRVYGPTFHKVVERLGVESVDIDVDQHPDLKEHYNVTSIPETIIVDDDANVVTRRQGALLYRDLTTMIEGVQVHG